MDAYIAWFGEGRREGETRREKDLEGESNVLFQSTHLAGDGKPVCTVDALDDAPDVLHGGHELRELVVLEVCQARDHARGYDEDICGMEGTADVRGRTRHGSAVGNTRPGTMGLRLTMAAARRER